MTIWRFEDDLGSCDIHISFRSKTQIRLRVIKANCIRISAPKHISLNRIQTFIHAQHAWIREQRQRLLLAQIDAHTTLWLHGRELPLIQQPFHQLPQLQHDSIVIGNQTAAVQQLADHLLQDAETWVLQRLHHILPSAPHQHAMDYRLSKAKSYWGICRPKQIKLNWRLVGAPQWVVDYVCWHEWCHLTHPNHSADFWHLVAQHQPHFRLAKQWLKQHGQALMNIDQTLAHWQHLNQ